MAKGLRWIAGTIVGVAFLLWLVLAVPKLLVPARSGASLADVPDPGKRHELQDARLKLQNDVRTTLLQGLGGVAVFVGAYFTWRQLQHNIQSSREAHDLERQGQITERFTRAIDQLGNDKGQLDVTLGGIYALERIAKDSPGDQATIAEILTAYVRGHAFWPPQSPRQLPEGTLLNQLPYLEERCSDVQAAMTVLGRMPPGVRGRLDLQRTDLRKAHLIGAHLELAALFGAHLEGANLAYAHLEGAALFGAHLEAANLADAHLKGADLRGAHLKKADLRGADLREASLQNAHLEEADLRSAHLEKANLFLAYLQGADLTGAHLQAACLVNANLQGAYLADAHLQGAWADDMTRWPVDFDWQAAGVLIAPTEPTG